MHRRWYVGPWYKGIMSPNDQFLLPATSKLQASREKINMLIPISVLLLVFVFFLPLQVKGKISQLF